MERDCLAVDCHSSTVSSSTKCLEMECGWIIEREAGSCTYRWCAEEFIVRNEADVCKLKDSNGIFLISISFFCVGIEFECHLFFQNKPFIYLGFLSNPFKISDLFI